MHGVTTFLQDKALLIAGTTGIAAATAHLAAKSGARVFLAGRTPEHGLALRDALRSRGARAEFLAADLTEDDAAERIAAGCVEALGRIDAAFHVAGISGRRFGDGPAHECTAAGWDAVMDTNARGVFLLCGAVLRRMLSQEPGPGGMRGNILNMASVLAWSPSPRHFATHAYAATPTRPARRPSSGSAGRWPPITPRTASGSTSSLPPSCARP